ncbi:MAG: NAD-dependent succinate-semialdehyde dehydrogenase [Pseudomonadota bacterium]
MPLDRLPDPNLLIQDCYVDGMWHNWPDLQRQTVRNPHDDVTIAAVPMAGHAQAMVAIDAAAAALPEWRGKLPQERADIVLKWEALIREHAATLAALVTLEQGKPVAEAKGEVLYGADFFRLAAEEATRVHGRLLERRNATAQAMETREPIGVVGAITPWNFPSVLVSRKVAPALAAGCTMVLKPAPETPLSALAIAKLGEEAGVPPGVLNVITGDAPAIGQALMDRPDVRMITFTGSTATGRLLGAQAAATVKRVALELGGNAPFLVFDDADVDLAVTHAVASRFRNAGQTCSCTNRFLVQRGVADDFINKLSEAVITLSPGDGFENDTDLGPLINAGAVERTAAIQGEAVAQGATVIVGGSSRDFCYEPTLLTGVTPEMRLSKEELFAPIAGIQIFETDEEGIALANATEYGLTAFFFASGAPRLFKISAALEAGIVGANTTATSSAYAPFGGIKQSGNGREGGPDILHDYLETKLTVIGL